MGSETLFVSATVKRVMCAMCKEARLIVYQSVDKRYGEKLLIGNNQKVLCQQKITYKIRDFHSCIAVLIP